MFDLTRSGDGITDVVLSGAKPAKVNDTHSLSMRAHKSIVAKRVAERFVTARELNGLSQTEGATLLGYKKSGQLSQIESGKKAPPLSVLVRASEAYRVSVDYLLGASEEPDRDPKNAMRLRILLGCRGVMEDMAHKLCDSVIRAADGMGENWQVAHAFMEEGEKLLQSFKAFRRLNGAAFDEEMRGGASLDATAERFELALAEARFQVERNRKLREMAVKQVAEPRRVAKNMDLFVTDQTN